MPYLRYLSSRSLPITLTLSPPISSSWTKTSSHIPDSLINMRLDLHKMRRNGEPIPPKQILLQHLREGIELAEHRRHKRYMIEYPPEASLSTPEADRERGRTSLDFREPLISCHVMECFNKTVPIFLFEGQGRRSWRNGDRYYRQLVYDYIYTRWFRPYRSELDWEQFPAIMLESDEPDPDFHDAVDCSITLNKILFHRLQSVRERVRTFTAEKAAAGLDLEQPLLPCGNNQEAYSRLLHAYNELAFELGLEPGLTRAYLKPDINRRIPQPLFGALSLVIRRKEIDPKNLVVADIPVWIVRTGEESGLSAPILFDDLIHQANQAQETIPMVVGKHAIRTTLSRAMDFIFSLSAREDAAAGFGPQPDPRLASQDPARIPGWREGCGLAGHLKLDLGGYTGLSPSDLPPGPSSMWVEDITPDMLATHWYAQEQKKIQARQGELPKSLVAIREENERKAALKAMGIVEQRWDKIDPNDLEDWEEQSAYWRRLELWGPIREAALKAKERIKRKAWEAHKTPPVTAASGGKLAPEPETEATPKRVSKRRRQRKRRTVYRGPQESHSDQDCPLGCCAQGGESAEEGV